ncbi:hypothetical protein F2Q70_00006635 [Brassica cretica]|uniref:Uncharacterized protein n=1 Tax=Brassica cretica TaxID=69181 RepID=A0A8S9IUI6_BRACR|nr:hypothetical protein F2Q70_00006635 [Brassica cretica]
MTQILLKFLVHKGGLKFLVSLSRYWIEAGVVPALVDLFRDGDEKGKLLAGGDQKILQRMCSVAACEDLERRR